MNDPYDTRTNDPRIVSVISYFTLLGWIIAFLLNNPKSEQASFHMRQSLGITLVFLVSSLCFIIPILGWIAGAIGYVIALIMWVLGLLHAIQEEEKVVPFMGERFQEWFQGV